jgi:hypothetical protein
MRTRYAISLLLVAGLASLSGCAEGSGQGAGDDAASEETTDGSTLPADFSPFGNAAPEPSQPSLTAAEETVPRAERAQLLVAASRVETAVRRWDGQVTACGVDTWTSCLARPRTDLLGTLFGVEGLLWRDRSALEGPCRARVRAAYNDVYGFRLSQARADYSDPAPGTAAGDPDLAILQVAVNALRTVPAALESLAATVCER